MSVRTALPTVLATLLIGSTAILPTTAVAASPDTGHQSSGGYAARTTSMHTEPAKADTTDMAVTNVKDRNCYSPLGVRICIL
ncbi:hypothetical protein D4740_07910 [Actinomyces sp. 2119]|uniref:hypothetical protein n=1 Tax=Actinomyces sp. 2119 TaxID=2321393 RepID=UPI000FF581F8|nr:hypothetical protein [Actinomyces sp. 2119]RJF41971.1 hypothetical protein D4740_07910 [Actinomyces sp. 2119]